MNMRVLTILGSPRSTGFSTTIARKFNAVAEANGAKVSTFELQKLDYSGCVGCFACKKKTDACALADDLTPVLAAMHDADIIVLATPVYFHDITGQMKLFIDRNFSLLTPEFHTGPRRSRLPEGKQLVFIQTQGADESMFDDIFTRYNNMFMFEKFADTHLVRGCNLNGRGGADTPSELLSRAGDLARRLVAEQLAAAS